MLGQDAVLVVLALRLAACEPDALETAAAELPMKVAVVVPDSDAALILTEEREDWADAPRAVTTRKIMGAGSENMAVGGRELRSKAQGEPCVTAVLQQFRWPWAAYSLHSPQYMGAKGGFMKNKNKDITIYIIRLYQTKTTKQYLGYIVMHIQNRAFASTTLGSTAGPTRTSCSKSNPPMRIGA
jgi:hypothetical protein